MIKNEYGETWPVFNVQVITWNGGCAIHTHIYIPYWDELVLINFIDGNGNLITENNVNYKIRRDYVKVLSK